MRRTQVNDSIWSVKGRRLILGRALEAHKVTERAAANGVEVVRQRREDCAVLPQIECAAREERDWRHAAQLCRGTHRLW